MVSWLFRIQHKKFQPQCHVTPLLIQLLVATLQTHKLKIKYDHCYNYAIM